MPSECRMPSIFGPMPEISLRSSGVAGFSIPAGRLGSSSDGFGAAAARFLRAAPVGSGFDSSGDLKAAAGSAFGSCEERCLSVFSTCSEALFALAASCFGGSTLAAFSAAGGDLHRRTATSSPRWSRARRSPACRRSTAAPARLPRRPSAASRGRARLLVARRFQHRLLVAQASSARTAARRRCGRPAARSARSRRCRRRRRR